jgi:hypothetical protein
MIIDKVLMIDNENLHGAKIIDFPTHCAEILPVKQNYTTGDDSYFRVNIANIIDMKT